LNLIDQRFLNFLDVNDRLFQKINQVAEVQVEYLKKLDQKFQTQFGHLFRLLFVTSRMKGIIKIVFECTKRIDNKQKIVCEILKAMDWVYIVFERDNAINQLLKLNHKE